ncbi:DUF7522 family protein [Halegenticoccus tardaugens]|uniref:DUF7522 family protein n=1 Tax=Halegenticoccus tardaugens TaxID=2071624 RepID=UPI00100B5D8B|nr:hypothetical protein [Halegenticoccus tardaugens]
MDDGIIDPDFSEELIRTCRTTLGDELRSIAIFTEDTYEQVYLRDDLKRTADLVGFAEEERLGFQNQKAYRNSQLGEYRATIRMFERGYLTRVIQGPVGVWVTTDQMSIDRFEELVTALKAILADTGDTDEGAEA